MNRNPLIPFALISIIGIILMFTLSFKGLGDHKELAEGGGEKKQEAAAAKPEEIYSQAGCIGCHGADYSGGAGPALKGIGDKYKVDQIKDILVNGKGSGMPGGLVPAEKVDEMAEWVSKIK